MAYWKHHTSRILAPTLAFCFALMVSVASFSQPRLPLSASGEVLHSAPAVVINEIAWGGTAADVAHEWVELYNNTANTISLDGWRLYANDGSPNFLLSGNIDAYAYYLIERNTDTVVSDNPADLIATFGLGLSNDGETLFLANEQDTIVDTANPDGGAWVNAEFGATPEFQSLERKRPTLPGTDENWLSNDGTHTVNGIDASGTNICGTPNSINAATLQSPTLFADLSIDIIGPDVINAGDFVTYTLTLGYTGNITASDTLITTTLPVDLVFIAQYSSYPFTLTDNQIIWTLGDIGASSPLSQTISVTTQHSKTTGVSLHTIATIQSAISDDTPYDNVDGATTDIHLPAFDEDTIKISALLYDGYQAQDADDAIQLANTGATVAILRGWQLCKDDDSTTTCRDLPDIFIPAFEDTWITRDSDAFIRSFGHSAGYTVPALPSFPNGVGCAIRLVNDSNETVDVVVYGEFDRLVNGWTSEPLRLYSVPPRQMEGQILARERVEQTYQLVLDTNTSADWMQNPDDAWNGMQFLYPGWDHELLYRPITQTATASIKLGIAPDNAYALVHELLSSATTNIDISMYTLTHPALIHELAIKARSGVHVKVLLEGNPVATETESEEWQTQLYGCSILEEAGGECWFMIHDPDVAIFNRYTYMHAKYAIIDDTWLLISTQNFKFDGLPSDPKDNGTLGSRGYVIATDAPEIVQRARVIFTYDLDPDNHNDVLRWNTQYTERYGQYDPTQVNLNIPDPISYTVRFPSPESISTNATFELFTAPEAALRTSDAILGMIRQTSAGDRIYVQQAYEYADWNDDPNLRLETYIEAAYRGAKVCILLNGKGYTDNHAIPPAENLETISFINAIAKSEGLDLRAALGNPTFDGIHSKVVLVALENGTRISHIGSINGSEASSKNNRELAVQITSPEIYNYLSTVFEMDWWLSNPIYLPLALSNTNTRANHATHIVISEVAYNESSVHEWVELYNPTPTTIDLYGYHLGDASNPDDFEAMFIFPKGAVIEAGGTLVIAVSGSDVFEADYEFYENNDSVPNMIVDTNWGSTVYPFALHNEGDEVLLLDGQYMAVDVLTYGTGSYPNIPPHSGALVIGASLERYPIDEDTDDCSVDFRERYPPTPGLLP